MGRLLLMFGLRFHRAASRGARKALPQNCEFVRVGFETGLSAPGSAGKTFRFDRMNTYSG